MMGSKLTKKKPRGAADGSSGPFDVSDTDDTSDGGIVTPSDVPSFHEQDIVDMLAMTYKRYNGLLRLLDKA